MDEFRDRWTHPGLLFGWQSVGRPESARGRVTLWPWSCPVAFCANLYAIRCFAARKSLAVAVHGAAINIAVIEVRLILAFDAVQLSYRACVHP